MKFNLFLILISISFNCLSKSKELIIYTSRKEHLVKDIFKKYEKETGIKIRYRTGSAKALIESIKAEKEKTMADILLTVDAGNLWFADNNNLFAKINSNVLNRNIPKYLRNNHNTWYGFSIRARTIVYNHKNVPTSMLSTYEDLGSDKWNKKLCLRTSKKIYTQSLVAMMIKELGYEKAKNTVKNWVSNISEIFSSDTSIIKAIDSGQCHVGIVNSYYLGRYIKKNPNTHVKLFWPNQKSYGVHVNISGAGVIKYSKNKKEAIKFLEWLSSNNAQKYFAQVNMEYPILNEFINSDNVVKSWGEFKPNKNNLIYAGNLQKQAIKLMYDVKYH